MGIRAHRYRRFCQGRGDCRGHIGCGIVVADDDGVSFVRGADAAAVAKKAKAREDAEQSKREALATGELGLDIYTMRPKLEAAGLKYYDERP